MNISQLRESRFLKKEDCGGGILVTVTKVTQENVAKEGAPEELKWCLHFKETDKPLVMNSTNGQIIASINGSDETDNWAGTQVVLYNDPTISFGGKITGGIRARARRVLKPAAAPVKPQGPRVPEPAPVTPATASCDESGAVEDDVPF